MQQSCFTVRWIVAKWVAASVLWSTAWVLIAISVGRREHPYAAWGLFVGLAGALVVNQILTERAVARATARERLSLEALADAIAKAMAQQQGVRRL